MPCPDGTWTSSLAQMWWTAVEDLKVYFIFKPKIFCHRAVLDHGATKLAEIDQPNFMHLSHVDLKKKIFLNIFMYFYSTNPEPLRGAFWTLQPLYERILLWMTRQCNIPNFKQLSLVILEKKILRKLYFLNPNLLQQGDFGPRGCHLNRLGIRPIGNATTFKWLSQVVLKDNFFFIF